MTPEGEERLISCALLLAALLSLGLLLLFSVGFVFLIIDMWGRWGW